MTFQQLMDCYYISNGDCNQKVYNMLLEQIKKHNVTPVIGAGLSFWAYPGWGELLTNAASSYGEEKTVQAFLKKNRYDDAAEHLETVIGGRIWEGLLNDAFDPSLITKKRNSRPYFQQSIPKVFQGTILTTNFDRAIEDLYGSLDVVNPSDDFQSDMLKRAQHQKTPLLIKLHGDIKDPVNMVLTTSKYDKFYGPDRTQPDMNKPLPQFLADTLGHNPLLFLGCSLGPDRTCAVIRGCVSSDIHFALMPLPKETANGDNPLKPKIKTNGKLCKKLLMRRAELSGMNILPIWYPSGNDMHNSALSAFFSQLEEDLGLDSKEKPDYRYNLSRQLVGRLDVIDTVVKALDSSSRDFIWVEGPTGIGKTEVCKAANNLMRIKYQSWNMPFIDVSNVSRAADFYNTIAKETQISLPEPVDEWEDILRQRLVHRYINPQGSHIPALYFDNFEDILRIENPQELEQIINWIRQLQNEGFSLLFSSQTKPPTVLVGQEIDVLPLDYGIDLTALSQEAFMELDSVTLFCSIWGHRPESPKVRDTLKTLIGNLEGHPLAIVLTATQARESVLGLAPVLEKWEQASQQPYNGSIKHTSLKTALRVAWESIQDDEAAVLYWALQHYSIQPIPFDFHKSLRRDISQEEFEKGMQALARFSLLDINNEAETVSMLLPIKMQLPHLAPKNQPCFEHALIQWADALAELLDKTYELQSEDYQSSHTLTVKMAPQLFHVMKQLLTCSSPTIIIALYRLIYNAENYYQYHMPSVELLEELKEHPLVKDASPLLAHIYLCLGDLLYHLDEWDKAENAYARAEELYRDVETNNNIPLLLVEVFIRHGDLQAHTNQGELNEAAFDQALHLFCDEQLQLGLANTLKCKGDLLCTRGKITEAQEAYNEAKVLFTAMSNDLGLANTLHSIGELFFRLGSTYEASKAFDDAEKLYCKEKDNMGLANTLQSKGKLLTLFDNADGAIKAFDKAKHLFTYERSILGLASNYQARSLLMIQLGEFRDALSLSSLANNHYRQIADRLGVANTLRDQGEALLGLNIPSKAEDCNHKAEELFLKIGDNLGLADVYRLYGNIQMHRNNGSQALSLFQKAIRLYHDEHAYIELAYTYADEYACLKTLAKDKDNDACNQWLLEHLPLLPKYVQKYVHSKMEQQLTGSL